MGSLGECMDNNKIEKAEKLCPYETKDISTLMPYQVGKTVKIPFYLFSPPKEIVRKPFSHSIFEYEQHPVIKRIPSTTTILSPALGLSEADDDIYRKIVDDLYKTTKSESEDNMNLLCQLRKPPCTTHFTTNPIKFKSSSIHCKLPHKLIAAGKEWDNNNPRCWSDNTRYFWQRYNEEKKRKEPNCRHVENLISLEKKQEINNLLNCQKLRDPHKTYLAGYSGFKPTMSWGVKLEKNCYPVEHVLRTTYQNSYK